MDITIEIPNPVAEILSSKGNKFNKLIEYGYNNNESKFFLKAWRNQVEQKTEEPKIDGNTTIEKEFKNDEVDIEINSITIKTMEDAVKAANIDLNLWEIERCITNQWQTTMKVKDEITGYDKPTQVTNYQVKLKLKVKIKNTTAEIFKELFKKLPINNTIYPKLPKKPEANLMLEIGLVDHHFGMLAWGKETLSDYDLKIAETLYVESVKKVIERIKNPEQIGKILIPIGNDFFHINDQFNETPRAKHKLDVDGRIPKVYSTGKLAAIKVVDYCRTIAPVEIIFVPGNHDPQISYFLCDTINSWFRNCPDVSVDMIDDMVNPTARKYRQWGNGLIGFSHGLDEKVEQLPLIMAAEVQTLWGNTTYREIHTGHYHKTKSRWFIGGETYNPVVVRTLPCLCGSDGFSYSHGWMAKGTQMAEFYIWDKFAGMIGYHVVKKEELI